MTAPSVTFNKPDKKKDARNASLVIFGGLGVLLLIVIALVNAATNAVTGAANGLVAAGGGGLLPVDNSNSQVAGIAADAQKAAGDHLKSAGDSAGFAVTLTIVGVLFVIVFILIRRRKTRLGTTSK